MFFTTTFIYIAIDVDWYFQLDRESVRVHPGFLAPKNRRWQFPVAFAVLLFVLVMNLFRGPSTQVSAKEMMPVKVQDVVVIKSPFLAGEPLDKSKLGIEKRAVANLPIDVVSSLTEVEGMVAAGPIPAGYPLARVLMAKPVPILPMSNEVELINHQLDPVEAMLQQIIPDTVALPVSFSSLAPKRGARVALALSNYTGDTSLILDAAWISESSGNTATIRVPPDKALFLQSVIKLSQLSLTYIEVPIEGASPYAGHAIENMHDLQVAMGLIPSDGRSRISQNDGPKTFRSYVWIKNTPMRYGLDDRGVIYLVDENGREVAGPVSSGLR